MLLRINDNDDNDDRPAEDVSAMLNVVLGGWGAMAGEEGSGEVG